MHIAYATILAPTCETALSFLSFPPIFSPNAQFQLFSRTGYSVHVCTISNSQVSIVLTDVVPIGYFQQPAQTTSSTKYRISVRLSPFRTASVLSDTTSTSTTSSKRSQTKGRAHAYAVDQHSGYSTNVQLQVLVYQPPRSSYLHSWFTPYISTVYTLSCVSSQASRLPLIFAF